MRTPSFHGSQKFLALVSSGHHINQETSQQKQAVLIHSCGNANLPGISGRQTNNMLSHAQMICALWVKEKIIYCKKTTNRIKVHMGDTNLAYVKVPINFCLQVPSMECPSMTLLVKLVQETNISNTSHLTLGGDIVIPRRELSCFRSWRYDHST